MSVLVVLSLTGFSTGHKSSGRHKSSHSDSDSGGGCSSSRQNHDSYTPRTTSTRSSSSALEDGTARVVSCATTATPYATVEVTNPNSRQATFEVEFAFADAAGKALSSQTKQINVPARGTSNVQVKADRSVLAELDHCQVEPEADLVR
ncbi:hypothetical protein ACGFWE_30720 [Streptomyces sp. NPDC048523]|uniref:hypothetical protein n=1 Tax=Streptomyces sp. NPDC048523 TaxID=3365567 RepID=UPI0037238202